MEAVRSDLAEDVEARRRSGTSSSGRWDGSPSLSKTASPYRSPVRAARPASPSLMTPSPSPSPGQGPRPGSRLIQGSPARPRRLNLPARSSQTPPRSAQKAYLTVSTMSTAVPMSSARGSGTPERDSRSRKRENGHSKAAASPGPEPLPLVSAATEDPSRTSRRASKSVREERRDPNTAEKERAGSKGPEKRSLGAQVLSSSGSSGRSPIVVVKAVDSSNSTVALGVRDSKEGEKRKGQEASAGGKLSAKQAKTSQIGSNSASAVAAPGSDGVTASVAAPLLVSSTVLSISEISSSLRTSGSQKGSSPGGAPSSLSSSQESIGGAGITLSRPSSSGSLTSFATRTIIVARPPSPPVAPSAPPAPSAQPDPITSTISKPSSSTTSKPAWRPAGKHVTSEKVPPAAAVHQRPTSRGIPGKPLPGLVASGMGTEWALPPVKAPPGSGSRPGQRGTPWGARGTPMGSESGGVPGRRWPNEGTIPNPNSRTNVQHTRPGTAGPRMVSTGSAVGALVKGRTAKQPQAALLGPGPGIDGSSRTSSVSSRASETSRVGRQGGPSHVGPGRRGYEEDVRKRKFTGRGEREEEEEEEGEVEQDGVHGEEEEDRYSGWQGDEALVARVPGAGAKRPPEDACEMESPREEEERGEGSARSPKLDISVAPSQVPVPAQVARAESGGRNGNGGRRRARVASAAEGTSGQPRSRPAPATGAERLLQSLKVQEAVSEEYLFLSDDEVEAEDPHLLPEAEGLLPPQATAQLQTADAAKEIHVAVPPQEAASLPSSGSQQRGGSSEERTGWPAVEEPPLGPPSGALGPPPGVSPKSRDTQTLGEGTEKSTSYLESPMMTATDGPGQCSPVPLVAEDPSLSLDPPLSLDPLASVHSSSDSGTLHQQYGGKPQGRSETGVRVQRLAQSLEREPVLLLPAGFSLSQSSSRNDLGLGRSQDSSLHTSDSMPLLRPALLSAGFGAGPASSQDSSMRTPDSLHHHNNEREMLLLELEAWRARDEALRKEADAIKSKMADRDLVADALRGEIKRLRGSARELVRPGSASEGKQLERQRWRMAARRVRQALRNAASRDSTAPPARHTEPEGDAGVPLAPGAHRGGHRGAGSPVQAPLTLPFPLPHARASRSPGSSGLALGWGLYRELSNPDMEVAQALLELVELERQQSEKGGGGDIERQGLRSSCGGRPGVARSLAHAFSGSFSGSEGGVPVGLESGGIEKEEEEEEEEDFPRGTGESVGGQDITDSPYVKPQPASGLEEPSQMDGPDAPPQQADPTADTSTGEADAGGSGTGARAAATEGAEIAAPMQIHEPGAEAGVSVEPQVPKDAEASGVATKLGQGTTSGSEGEKGESISEVGGTGVAEGQAEDATVEWSTPEEATHEKAPLEGPILEEEKVVLDPSTNLSLAPVNGQGGESDTAPVIKEQEPSKSGSSLAQAPAQAPVIQQEPVGSGTTLAQSPPPGPSEFQSGDLAAKGELAIVSMEDDECGETGSSLELVSVDSGAEDAEPGDEAGQGTREGAGQEPGLVAGEVERGDVGIGAEEGHTVHGRASQDGGLLLMEVVPGDVGASEVGTSKEGGKEEEETEEDGEEDPAKPELSIVPRASRDVVLAAPSHEPAATLVEEWETEVMVEKQQVRVVGREDVEERQDDYATPVAGLEPEPRVRKTEVTVEEPEAGDEPGAHLVHPVVEDMEASAGMAIVELPEEPKEGAAALGPDEKETGRPRKVPGSTPSVPHGAGDREWEGETEGEGGKGREGPREMPARGGSLVLEGLSDDANSVSSLAPSLGQDEGDPDLVGVPGVPGDPFLTPPPPTPNAVATSAFKRAPAPASAPQLPLRRERRVEPASLLSPPGQGSFLRIPSRKTPSPTMQAPTVFKVSPQPVPPKASARGPQAAPEGGPEVEPLRRRRKKGGASSGSGGGSASGGKGGSGLRRVSSFLSPSWASNGERVGPPVGTRNRQWRMSPIVEGVGGSGGSSSSSSGRAGSSGLLRGGGSWNSVPQSASKGVLTGTDTFGRRRADLRGFSNSSSSQWAGGRRGGTVRSGSAASGAHGYTLFPIPDSPIEEAVPQHQESVELTATRSDKGSTSPYQDPQKRLSWKAFKSFLSPARKFPAKSPGR